MSNKELRYIADGAAPLYAEPVVDQSFVAHYPDDRQYKNYLKATTNLPSPLYMPFWELKELKEMRAKKFPHVSLEKVRSSFPRCHLSQL